MLDLLSKIKENCRLNNSASDAGLLQLEADLNLNLPKELVDLLKETNGVSDKYGIELIWSTDKIFRQNTYFRTNDDFKKLYMSFENLLFFSDEGNGDLYAFVVLNNSINRDDVFVWEHETDSRI